MPGLRRLIASKEWRERLAFVGAGLAAVVAGGWALYTHLTDKPAPAPITLNAPGGVAAQSISGPVAVYNRAP